MTRQMLSVYLLRARDAAQSTFTQPLLNRTNEPNSDLDSTVATDTISKPLNKITIRIKSGDSTIGSGPDDDQSGTVQDPLASCIHNHQCLSPSKRSAKALIYFLYLADLVIGLYLTVFSLQKQSEDDYGIIMMSLTAGLLLIGGSVAGICLHTPLGALFCNDDTDVNRSLMIFNTSFAFIGVGIYYLIGLSLLVSPLFNKSLDETNSAQLSLQCIKSVTVFSLSVLEGYRVLFIHYHHHNRAAEQTSRPLAIV